MLKTLKSGLLLGLVLSACAARAELPADYKVVLLTENFPPFNMAVDDKNFARDDGIDGISAEIVRAMFKACRHQLHTLTLRFPWDRLYRLTLDKANYGLFSTTFTPERQPLFKWVGPLAKTGWVLLAAPGNNVSVASLKDAAQYQIGAYKNDAVSQHPGKPGLDADQRLARSGKTSRNCSVARSTCGPPLTRLAATWPSRKVSVA